MLKQVANYDNFTKEDLVRFKYLIKIYELPEKAKAIVKRPSSTFAQNLDRYNNQLLPKRTDRPNLSMKEYLEIFEKKLIKSC